MILVHVNANFIREIVFNRSLHGRFVWIYAKIVVWSFGLSLRYETILWHNWILTGPLDSTSILKHRLHSVFAKECVFSPKSLILLLTFCPCLRRKWRLLSDHGDPKWISALWRHMFSKAFRYGVIVGLLIVLCIYRDYQYAQIVMTLKLGKKSQWRWDGKGWEIKPQKNEILSMWANILLENDKVSQSIMI